MSTCKAIVMDRTGGPDVLCLRERPVAEPAADEVLVRHAAIGVNFIDTYHRGGFYPVAKLPCVLGTEGAGVVEKLGGAVTDLKIGDRVAYVEKQAGSYAEKRVVAAASVVKLPNDVDDRTAASVFLKGLTAYFLIHKTYPVGTGTTLLVHAAAGGVGALLTQWSKHLGATVIGTVGDESKAALARSNGCDHVILYKRENVADAVHRVTGGRGADVVYDSVGRDTFAASLDCLKPFGMLVCFGQSSGAVAPFDVGTLAAKGSLYLTRPSLFTHIADRKNLDAYAAALFDALRTGIIKPAAPAVYALADARRAHEDLESRKTTGSLVLLP